MDSAEDNHNTSSQLVPGILLPQPLPRSLRDSLTEVTQRFNEYWRNSGERSTFFVPNPETLKAEVKEVSEPQYSVEKTSETVSYRDAVKAVTSNRSSASVDDHMRPVSYASVTSQDANSLLRRMTDYYQPIDSQEIKIAVVGKKFTGKTQLIQRIVGKEFSCQYNADLVVRVHGKVARYRQHIYAVNLLDILEDALAKELDSNAFCSGVMAAFVVYDLLDENSLLAAVELKKRINNSVCMESGDSIPVFLIGNKCDMQGMHHDGASTAEQYKFSGYFITSAKTGECIGFAMRSAVEQFKKIQLDEYPRITCALAAPDYVDREELPGELVSEVPSQTPSEETQYLPAGPVQVTDPTPVSSSVFASGSGASHQTELMALTDPPGSVPQHYPLAPQPNYDALENQEIKVLFCGDQCTGRTSLIRQIISFEYSHQYNHTVLKDYPRLPEVCRTPQDHTFTS